MALAPSRALLGVPSSSIIARSRPAWSVASRPRSASASSPLTFPTARVTPLPFHALPPSRSSTASNSPVEAPDGTAARPLAPERRMTSTSTVGLPRESRIWRAWIFSIWLMWALNLRAAQPRLRVEIELAVGPQVLPLLPVRPRQLGCRLEPTAEALGARAQRQLGVDLQLARGVDRREEHVAD